MDSRESCFYFPVGEIIVFCIQTGKISENNKLMMQEKEIAGVITLDKGEWDLARKLGSWPILGAR